LKIGKGNNVQFQSSQIAFFHEAKKHKAIVKVLMRKNDLIYLIDSNVIINSVYKVIKGDRVSLQISELSKAFIWGAPWNWREITKKIYS
jgi:penicillin-binding protein-related factor A (putative recombinase)